MNLQREIPMNMQDNDRIRRVSEAIGRWAGEDAAGHRPPGAVAIEIDEIYRQLYGATSGEVRAATQAIRAGGTAQEASAA
jgi:hypothetical protein